MIKRYSRAIFVFWQRFFLGLYYYVKELGEYVKVVALFYRYPRFALADLLLHISYLFSHTDSVCMRFIQGHSSSEVQDVYGETPLTCFLQICRAANIQKSDRLYELGCGRGRLVLWANIVFNIDAVGIDINPTFIKRAQRVAWLSGVEQATFYCGNMMHCDLSDATVIYLYGSAFEERAIPNLLAMLNSAAKGATIITTTWSLNELSDKKDFRIVKQLRCRYPWGKTTVYIHTKVTSSTVT